MVHEFKPQELANLMWAFASLEHYDRDMVRAVAARALRMAPLFKEQELSNIIWALGRCVLSSFSATTVPEVHHEGYLCGTDNISVQRYSF